MSDRNYYLAWKRDGEYIQKIRRMDQDGNPIRDSDGNIILDERARWNKYARYHHTVEAARQSENCQVDPSAIQGKFLSYINNSFSYKLKSESKLICKLYVFVPISAPHLNNGVSVFNLSPFAGEISGILFSDGTKISATSERPAKLSSFSSNPSTAQ